jgi:hypothetical protein
MQILPFIQKNSFRNKVNLFLLTLVFLITLTGCAGSYGRIKRDAEVTNAFESNQVRSDYTYYYYGFDTRPYAIIGVNPKYDAGSKMWREVDPQSEAFKKMTFWIWEAYDYYPYGAHILDPAGDKVGLWFSSIRIVAIKFVGENRIMVMPHTPFLYGPAVNNKNEAPYYGVDSSEFHFAKTH